MSTLTLAWTASGAICLTLALVYAFVWLQRREAAGYLFFSLAALGASGCALAELMMMRATTIEAYVFWLRLEHIPIFLMLVSLAWFVVTYFGTARPWLAWAVTGAWALFALGSLVAPYTLIYSEVTALRELTLPWGERFVLATGEPHPLKLSADLVNLVLLAFFADASWSLWRRGDRRRALLTGGSLVVFLGAAGLHTPLVDVGVLDSPYLISFAFLAVVLAMAAELTRDVVRSATLSAQVRANERRWRTLAEDVQLLVIGLDRDHRINYANPYTAELTGFAREELLGRSIEEVSPPDLRDGYIEAFEGRVAGDRPPFSEARVRTKEGKELTVIFTSVLLSDPNGTPSGLLSVGRDITAQRLAEDARDRALARTRRALEEVEALKARLEQEVVQLRGQLKGVEGFDEIVGRSDALLYVLRRVEQVAPLETTVLIQGETGVGKELIARAIHSRSRRSSHPLVTVDCAALPTSLIEAELFGHEKGAFTGADRMRRGRFELADGGTVFLDEVGELAPELQGKLLRVIQEGEVERIGGGGVRKVDVRVMAATNRRLEEEVRQGRFREDLFYRLNVFPLTVPPLRLRRDDIPLLVETFVRRFAAAHGKPIASISQPVMDEFVTHEWPGNVRELSNIVEQAVITSTDGTLRLPSRLTGPGRANSKAAGGRPDDTDRGTLEDVEREYVLEILETCSWRIEGAEGAAERLGLHPNTLRNRMRKLGLRRPRAPERETEAGGRSGADPT
jgi:PAS domain S-box-containing protein